MSNERLQIAVAQPALSDGRHDEVRRRADFVLLSLLTCCSPKALAYEAHRVLLLEPASVAVMRCTQQLFSRMQQKAQVKIATPNQSLVLSPKALGCPPLAVSRTPAPRRSPPTPPVRGCLGGRAASAASASSAASSSASSSARFFSVRSVVDAVTTYQHVVQQRRLVWRLLHALYFRCGQYNSAIIDILLSCTDRICSSADWLWDLSLCRPAHVQQHDGRAMTGRGAKRRAES